MRLPSDRDTSVRFRIPRNALTVPLPLRAVSRPDSGHCAVSLVVLCDSATQAAEDDPFTWRSAAETEEPPLLSGTLKALDYGMGPVAATTLGVTTAVGGGVLRDVIARETPAIVRPDSELYAVAAVAGAAAVTITWEVNAYGPALGAVVAAAVFGIRGIAIYHRWHGPRAWRR